MIIRSDQMREFSEAASRSFEDEMVAHLAQFSPPLFNAIKGEQLRLAIRFGIPRAARYGITFRGPIRFYLELMLLFGCHFDTDPQYPWIAEILKDRIADDQMKRASLLYERTRNYRQTVGGPDDQYTLRALRDISMLARQPLPFSAANLVPGMLREMSRVYPEKCNYVGEDRLKLLIRAGMATAEAYGFSSDRAVALPVVLMFAFGHGCFNDLLYPWIAKTVQDRGITDPEGRARRLEKKSSTWLDHVLGYFDRADQT
ncbi:MAG: hypothetical protein ABI822_23445 [Bryobacteraceae bacterium]